jgi:hypothetical protein
MSVVSQKNDAKIKRGEEESNHISARLYRKSVLIHPSTMSSQEANVSGAYFS